MQQRKLGNQGLTVSALGYGAMGIHSFYGPGDEQQGIKAIQTAYDHGVTFLTRPNSTAGAKTRNWWGRPSAPSGTR
jgi:predicted aldo/keto reductase-like oxidoreductase